MRGVGLDHRPALPCSPRPARPTTWVSRLKVRSAGAVVVHVQGQIRRQHAHQRHIVKIQPLGHHLGPQQDGDAAAAETPAGASRGPLPTVSASIRRSSVPGNSGVQLLLHPLGTEADVLHSAAAVGTGIRRRLGVAAVVAHQPPVGGVVGQVARCTGDTGAHSRTGDTAADGCCPGGSETGCSAPPPPDSAPAPAEEGG